MLSCDTREQFSQRWRTVPARRACAGFFCPVPHGHRNKGGYRSPMPVSWTYITGHTSCADVAHALVGIYELAPGRVVLIDSGGRPSKEFLDGLRSRGLTVRAIICTHLHIDHVANNRALIERDGAELFAYEDNVNYFNHTALSTDWRFIGGPPTKCPITVIPSGSSFVEVDGARFGILPTPGHIPGHTAIITPDGVCHLGDAVMSGKDLSRAKMPYMLDVDEAVVSMEAVRETDYPFYLVSHCGIFTREEMPAMVDENIQKELDIYDLLRSIAVEPMEMEELVTRFMDAADIHTKFSIAQEATRSTCRARVYGLINAGEFILDGSVVRPQKK